jgi:hypothetical protein
MLTEKPGFETMMNVACPMYKLKKREFFTSFLTKKYDSKYEELKIELSTVKDISFTTDMWTNNKKKRSFLRYYIKTFNPEIRHIS